MPSSGPSSRRDQVKPKIVGGWISNRGGKMNMFDTGEDTMEETRPGRGKGHLYDYIEC